MKLYHRFDWHARPTRGYPGSRPVTDWGTVHWSATDITPTGSDKHDGHTEPLLPKPAKPGPKWYQLWRSNATPRLQRAKISRVIRKYNRELREYNLVAVGVDGPVDPRIQALEVRTMQEFQNYHMDVHGWSDIGYHRVIFASGNVYEGRPYSMRGAHAYGANHATGYCLVMGPGDQPTPEMLQSLKECMKLDGVTKYKGHRQWPGNATQCPGDDLIRILDLPVE